MFVSEELADAVMMPWEDTDTEYRFGQLLQTLNNFTEGRRISVAEDPYDKHKKTFLARLDPIQDEAWQIRSIAPKPAIRVFGHFAFKDTFVALTWRHRSDLDGPRSKSWRDEIQRCKAEWRKLFHPYQPHRGESLHDYLSEPFFVV